MIPTGEGGVCASRIELPIRPQQEGAFSSRQWLRRCGSHNSNIQPNHVGYRSTNHESHVAFRCDLSVRDEAIYDRIPVDVFLRRRRMLINAGLDDSEESFSACLIIMDDNHRLIEWLAYHYYVLPLRYLVVVSDPRALTSPSAILNRWRSRMTILEWNVTDFTNETFLGGSPKRVYNDHLKRQSSKFHSFQSTSSDFYPLSTQSHLWLVADFSILQEMYRTLEVSDSDLDCIC